jgi:hypothetical protein
MCPLPEIVEIHDPVAEDVWRLRAADGKTVSHRIVVGRPFPEDPEREDSDWCCPVMIEGSLSRPCPAMGVGPVDALMNAMVLVRRFFESNKDSFVDMESRGDGPPSADLTF